MKVVQDSILVIFAQIRNLGYNIQTRGVKS